MRVVVGVAETSNKICRYVFERRGVCETVWGTDGVFQLLQFAPETVVAHWVLQRFLCFSMKRHFYVIMHYAVFGIVMKQESEKLWNKKHTIESETLFAEQNYGSDTDQMSWFVSRSRSTARLLWSMVNQYASHSIFRLQGHFMSLPMLLCSYECNFMFFFNVKYFLFTFFYVSKISWKKLMRLIGQTHKRVLKHRVLSVQQRKASVFYHYLFWKACLISKVTTIAIALVFSVIWRAWRN